MYARISAAATSSVSGTLAVYDASHASPDKSVAVSGTVNSATNPGVATVGMYDPASSMFMLRNTNDSGFANECCGYGAGGAGMAPIAGDWNGDGIDSIGLYNPTTATFYLRNTNVLQGSNDKGYADAVFVFGPANAGYEPLVGNWDGQGGDGIGLYDPATSTFYLRNTIGPEGPNDHGYADVAFTFGAAHSNMLPLAGDWDGSGSDGVGLYSQATSTFYLRQTPQLQGAGDQGFADATLNYGAGGKGLLPVAGDWNGDGRDGIGLYDPATSTFLLRNAIQLQGSSDKGYADLTFLYGKPGGSQLPLAGKWTAAGSANQPLEVISGFPTTTTNVRLTANTPLQIANIDSGTNVTGGNVVGGSTSLLNYTSVPTGSVAQSGIVDSRAVDQIDLSAVAAAELGHFAGTSDPDALAGAVLVSI